MTTRAPRLRAVLFDLDDTLYDHAYAQRAAVCALHDADPDLRRVPIEELVRTDQRILEDVHRSKVLTGRLSADAARGLRMHRLYACFGIAANASRLRASIRLRRTAYREHQRIVPGARPVLAALRARGVHVGVVSNNLLAEQRRKLEEVGLARWVDALTVSEEEGVAKPHSAIFRRAMARVPCTPAEAVMVGDSWEADILGARAVGLGAVWIASGPRRPAIEGVVQIESLLPVRRTLRALRAACRGGERSSGT